MSDRDDWFNNPEDNPDDEDFDLDWLNDDDDDTSSRDKGGRAGSGSSFGFTGELPWMSGADSDDDDSPGRADEDTFDWLSDDDGEASTPPGSDRTGVTSFLEWRQGAPGMDDPDAGNTDALLDWMQDSDSSTDAFDMDDDASTADEIDEINQLGEDEAEPADLPPWLRGMEEGKTGLLPSLPDDFDVRSGRATTPEPEPESDFGEDDWMADFVLDDDEPSAQPDWLSSSTDDTPDDDEETGDVPKWLQDTGSFDTQGAFAQAAGVTDDDEDDEPDAADEIDEIPAWLSSTGSFDADMIASVLNEAEASSADDDENVPDWLSSTGSIDDKLEDTSNTPIWLDQQQAPQEEAETFDSDAPAWLSDVDDPGLKRPAFEDSGDDVSAWLDSDDDLDKLFGGSAQQDASDDGEVPIWLQGMEGEKQPAKPPTGPLSESIDGLFDDMETDEFELPSETESTEVDFDFGDLLASDEPDSRTEEDYPYIDDDYFAQMGIGQDETDEDEVLDFVTETDSDIAADFGDWFDESDEEQEAEVTPGWLDTLDNIDLGDLLEQDDDSLPPQSVTGLLAELEAQPDDGSADDLLDHDTTSPPLDSVMATNDELDLDALLASFDDEGDESDATDDDRVPESVDLDDLFGSFDTLDDEEDREDADLFTEAESGALDFDERVVDDDTEVLSAEQLDFLRQATMQDEGSSAAAIVRQQQSDVPLDSLPESLRLLRERGLEITTEDAEIGIPNDTDALDAVLPDVTEVLAPARIAKSATVTTSDFALTPEQRTHADLLRSLAGTQAMADESRTTARPRRRRQRLPIMRILISVMLLVALIIPFVVDVNLIPPPQPYFASGSPALAAFDRLNAVRPGDLVLVAAEYGSSTAAELDPLNEAILTHILQIGGKPVIVSRNAIGLLRSQQIITDIAGSDEQNQSYYLIRYLPGNDIAVRDLSTNVGEVLSRDIEGASNNLRVGSLDDFEAIVLLAENVEGVRTWMEQVAPTTNTPFIVGTTRAAMPLAVPYIDGLGGNDIGGWLIGYEDAYTYNAVLLPSDTPTATSTTTPTATFTETHTPTATFTATQTHTPTATLTASPTLPITDTPAITQDPSPTREMIATDDTIPTQEIITTEIAQVASNTPTATITPSPTLTFTPTLSPTPTATATETVTPSPTATLTPTPIPVIPVAVVTVDGGVNIRSGPGTNFPPVGVAQQGDVLPVIGENDNASWINVQLPDGEQGWIAEFLLSLEERRLDELENGVPVPTAQPTATEPTIATDIPALDPTPTRDTGSGQGGGSLTGIVDAQARVNIRNGPGTDFGVVAAVAPGTALTIIGFSDDETWVNVVLPDGSEGWIADFLLIIQPTGEAIQPIGRDHLWLVAGRIDAVAQADAATPTRETLVEPASDDPTPTQMMESMVGDDPTPTQMMESMVDDDPTPTQMMESMVDDDPTPVSVTLESNVEVLPPLQAVTPTPIAPTVTATPILATASSSTTQIGSTTDAAQVVYPTRIAAVVREDIQAREIETQQAQWQAIIVGTIAAIILIGLGNLFYLIGGILRPEDETSN